MWRISETEKSLKEHLALTADESAELVRIAAPKRRREWLAARALVRTVLTRAGVPYQGLQKDHHGRPSLRGGGPSVSIAHTFPFAVARFGDGSVGIDIERLQPRLWQVLPRVLSAEELAAVDGNLWRAGLFWTAKETLYKAGGQSGVVWRTDLRVRLTPDGLYGEHRSVGWRGPLRHARHNDFAIVFI